MNVESYSEIMIAQGKDPLYHASGKQYNLVVESFRTDLLKNKVVWVNEWKADLHNFLKNNHPFYSIFTCPKEHEYTRRERFVVLVCCSSLFSFVALLAVSTLDTLQTENASGLKLFMTENAINITGAILISIVMAKLQIMATCACYQQSGEVKRERMEKIGHIVMGIWSLISIGAFILGVLMCVKWGLPAEFFRSLAVQVVANVVVPTIFLVVAFHLLWTYEHRMKTEKAYDKFCVCFHDYCDFRDGQPLRSCTYMERKGDIKVNKIVMMGSSAHSSVNNTGPNVAL